MNIEEFRPSGVINGHEYVDLGLSVLWATCNVGAGCPESCGDYFAWGKINPKDTYTEENSVTRGKPMWSIAGDAEYDAARANWGGTWRLPTAEEIDELVDKCQHEWTTLNGVKGFKVTGPNGNSIFLPAAGYHSGKSLLGAGDYSYYWGATPSEDGTRHAYELIFHSGYYGRDRNYRPHGLSVRPVSE